MRLLFLVDVLKICRWMGKEKKINLLQLRKHMQADKKVYGRNKECGAKKADLLFYVIFFLQTEGGRTKMFL